MFNKVLIANRGAIACRIIRSLHKLGIASVAVYSEADAHALHVAQANESVCIGPAPAAQSYLVGSKLIEAALQTGAQAIHPGYGFLSENPGFVEACEAAGLVFLGPTPAQMRVFGLKHSARALAAQAHVQLLPGTGLLQNPRKFVQSRAGGHDVINDNDINAPETLRTSKYIAYISRPGRQGQFGLEQVFTVFKNGRMHDAPPGQECNMPCNLQCLVESALGQSLPVQRHRDDFGIEQVNTVDE